MTRKITTVAFDADDTLWHNERFFALTQDRFNELLQDYADPDHLSERLLAAELRNLDHYGYGIKGFMLSMIETALEVTENRVSGRVISEILAAGQDMLSHTVELLPHARAAVDAVADTYDVLLITKGDLLDQERKLAASGLGDLFDAVEIVSEKTPQIYHDIFKRHGSGADRGLMAGNSMKSDVVPMIAAGGWAVHVPLGLEWALEKAEAPVNAPRFFAIKNLSKLPTLIKKIEAI